MSSPFGRIWARVDEGRSPLSIAEETHQDGLDHVANSLVFEVEGDACRLVEEAFRPRLTRA